MELWEREDLAAARDAGVEFWPGQRELMSWALAMRP